MSSVLLSKRDKWFFQEAVVSHLMAALTHSDSGALPVDRSPHRLAPSSQVSVLFEGPTAMMKKKKKSDTCGQRRRRNPTSTFSSHFLAAAETLCQRRNSGCALRDEDWHLPLSVLSCLKRFCQESGIRVNDGVLPCTRQSHLNLETALSSFQVSSLVC